MFTGQKTVANWSGVSMIPLLVTGPSHWPIVGFSTSVKKKLNIYDFAVTIMFCQVIGWELHLRWLFYLQHVITRSFVYPSDSKLFCSAHVLLHSACTINFGLQITSALR